jgi:hypothetical protein
VLRPTEPSYRAGAERSADTCRWEMTASSGQQGWPAKRPETAWLYHIDRGLRGTVFTSRLLTALNALCRWPVDNIRILLASGAEISVFSGRFGRRTRGSLCHFRALADSRCDAFMLTRREPRYALELLFTIYPQGYVLLKGTHSLAGVGTNRAPAVSRSWLPSRRSVPQASKLSTTLS